MAEIPSATAALWPKTQLPIIKVKCGRFGKQPVCQRDSSKSCILTLITAVPPRHHLPPPPHSAQALGKEWLMMYYNWNNQRSSGLLGIICSSSQVQTAASVTVQSACQPRPAHQPTQRTCAHSGLSCSQPCIYSPAPLHSHYQTVLATLSIFLLPDVPVTVRKFAIYLSLMFLTEISASTLLISACWLFSVNQ